MKVSHHLRCNLVTKNGKNRIYRGTFENRKTEMTTERVLNGVRAYLATTDAVEHVYRDTDVEYLKTVTLHDMIESARELNKRKRFEEEHSLFRAELMSDMTNFGYNTLILQAEDAEDPVIRAGARRELQVRRLWRGLHAALLRAVEKGDPPGPPAIEEESRGRYFVREACWRTVIERGGLEHEIAEEFSSEEPDVHREALARLRGLVLDMATFITKMQPAASSFGVTPLLATMEDTHKREYVRPVAILLLVGHGALLDSWFTHGFHSMNNADRITILARRWALAAATLAKMELNFPPEPTDTLFPVFRGLREWEASFGTMPWRDFATALENCSVHRRPGNIQPEYATQDFALRDYALQVGKTDSAEDVLVDVCRFTRRSGIETTLWRPYLNEWAKNDHLTIVRMFDVLRTSSGARVVSAKERRFLEYRLTEEGHPLRGNPFGMFMAPHPELTREAFRRTDVEHETLSSTLRRRTLQMETIPEAFMDAPIAKDVYVQPAVLQLRRLLAVDNWGSAALDNATTDWCVYLRHLGYLDTYETRGEMNVANEARVTPDVRVAAIAKCVHREGAIARLPTRTGKYQGYFKYMTSS